MLLYSLFSELSKYYKILEKIDYQNLNINQGKTLERLLSGSPTHQEIFNANLFGKYYANLITKSEKFCSKKIESELYELFFVLQNFLAHSLPTNRCYVKFNNLNLLDWMAPVVDISGRIIYTLTPTPLQPDEREIISNSSGILQDGLPLNKHFMITLQQKFIQKINHVIGGLSIVIDEVNIATNITLDLSVKFDGQCDVIVIGKKELIDNWRMILAKKKIDFKQWQELKIPLNQVSTEYDTVATGGLILREEN